MIRIDEENSKLRNRKFPLGKGIRKHLADTLRNYRGDKTKPGYKRLNNLLSSENGVSYRDMKRIKNFFDTYSGTKKGEEYILNGGSDMQWWVNNTLGTARKEIDDEKRAKKDAGQSNAYIRSHEKDRQRRKNRPTGVKFRTSNRRLMNNDTLKYENIVREGRLISIIRSAVNEAIAGNRMQRLFERELLTDMEENTPGPAEISDRLESLGWCCVSAEDVQHPVSRQTGVRYRIEPDRNPADEETLRAEMEDFIGPDRVIFSAGHYRYAPETRLLSMIVLD